MIDTSLVRRLKVIESLAVIPRVASTNLIARRIVNECIDNELSLPQAMIIAGEQFAGQGRNDRRWSSPAGKGIYATTLLSRPARELPLVPLAMANIIATYLRETYAIDARIKWPNDVLVGGRKIAGVLLERHGDAVILGIGINVTRDAIPSELAERATSIADEGGSPDREALLEKLLLAVGRWRARLEREGFEPVRAQWTAQAGMLGRHVTVDGVAGIALGIDTDGALLVQTDTGPTRVLAGDVVERRAG